MPSAARRPKRQNIRRMIGIFLVILFPAIYYYFSPYISIMGAVQGVIAGSLFLFALLFLSALAVGRAFCSWACPAGALMDLVATGRPKPIKRARLHRIKYLIWAPWLATILLLIFQHRGALRPDPLYATESGFSVSSVPSLIMYFLVALVFAGISALVGRRAACHILCWMAPFMVLGRSLSTAMGLPALRLRSNPATCTDCKNCERGCPMGLPVNSLVKKGKPDHIDCILCGECVDRCPSKCIAYAWAKPQNGRAS